MAGLLKCKKENYLDLLCANVFDLDIEKLNTYTIDIIKYISDFIVKTILLTRKCYISSSAIQDDFKVSIKLLDIQNCGIPLKMCFLCLRRVN